MPDTSSYMQGVGTQAGNMFNQQNAAVGNYLQNYSNAINNQETAPAMWQRLANETGYNAANQQAMTLNNQLNYVPQTETAAMKGFDVNNNQLNTDIGLQEWKLAPLAQRASSNATNIAQNIMNPQIQAEQAQQQKELTPYTAEGSFLTDYMARQTSTFTTDAQAQLQALEAKQTAGVALTNDEQNNLNSLKIAEEGYNNAITLAQISQQYKTLGQGDTLLSTGATPGSTAGAYNPFTTVPNNTFTSFS